MSRFLAHVASDPSLLERCAYSMFASAQSVTDDRRRARLSAAAIDPERMETGRSHLAVPFAVRLWLSYLLWLETVLRLFDSNVFADLTSAEGAGLAALARARSRFVGEHSFCPQCSFANPRGVARCRRCSLEF